MTRGTTPHLLFTVEKDITDCWLYISIRDERSGLVFTWQNDSSGFACMTWDEEDKVTEITLMLTQDETLKLTRGTVSVQIRFVSSDGEAGATSEEKLLVLPVIYDGEIRYGGDQA